MKKALTIGAIILLSSCTTERVVYVEPTTTTTEAKPEPARETRQTRERAFLDFVETSFGDIVGLEYEIVQAGWRTCENADAGWTAQDFVENAMGIAESRDSQLLLAAVIAGALNFLCPEHAHVLDGLEPTV